MNCRVWFGKMKNAIRVSVITPCLNSAKTIRDTIESVRNQTYKNIEYIIVDGGSTDETLEIIKEYCPKFNGRMKYISEKDKGIYNAMNKGIKMSTGNVIGIINSDDFYETDAVEKVVNYLSGENYQVIYGLLNIIDKRGQIKIHQAKHTSLLKRVLPHPTCFFTRSIYRDYGLYSEHYKLASDYELMLRVYRHKNVKFTYIPEILANYRLGGSSSDSRVMFEANFIRLRYGGLSLKEFLIKNYRDYIWYVK